MTGPSGARPRVLLVSEITAVDQGDGVQVSAGHLRRYERLGARWDLTWTLTPRVGPDHHRGRLPDGTSAVWLPAFASAGEWARRTPSLIRALWRPIRQHQLVLVNIPCFAALVALVLARLAGTPAVALMLSRWHQLRSDPTRRFPLDRLLWWLLTQLTVLLADVTLSAGEELGTQVVRRWRHRVRPTVFSGLPPGDRELPPLREPSAPLRLLTVSRLLSTKRVDRLVEAISVLADWGRDATLTIVGDGPERSRLEAMVARLSLEGRVTFRGWIDDWDELAGIYGDHDLFLFASEDEGLPLVTLEAMTLGLPVVSTRPGSLVHLLVDGVNARTVAAPEPAWLAQAVVTAVDDREGTERMRVRAFEDARPFDTDRWVDELLAVCDDLHLLGRGVAPVTKVGR